MGQFWINRQKHVLRSVGKLKDGIAGAVKKLQKDEKKLDKDVAKEEKEKQKEEKGKKQL